MDTTLPNIGDRWKQIRINIADKKFLKNLSEKIKSMYLQRKDYWNEYKSLFGDNG